MMSFSALIRRTTSDIISSGTNRGFVSMTAFGRSLLSTSGENGRIILKTGDNHSIKRSLIASYLAAYSSSSSSSFTTLAKEQRSVGYGRNHAVIMHWSPIQTSLSTANAGGISSGSSHHNKQQIRLRSTHAANGGDATNTTTSKSDKDLPPVDWDEALDLIVNAKQNLVTNVTTDQSQALSQSIALKDLALRMAQHFSKRGTIPANVMEALLNVSIARHDHLPNVIPVTRSVKANGERGSVVIVGDTHGQYLDFHQIIQSDIAGTPSDDNRFIINGDIVDRGKMSVEILAVLLTFKLACDSSVTILRGNHETTEMNKYYGFEKEVLEKFHNDKLLLQKFRSLFTKLPLASVIEKAVFVVHGGLGRHSYTMTIPQLNELDRKSDQNRNVVSELLWGDPKEGLKGFKHNAARGGGEVFGADVTSHFLDNNNLDLLVRSHEVRMQGFDAMHDNRLITIFSAPNYCGSTGNLGAVMKFDSYKGEELNEQNKDHLLVKIVPFGPKHYPPRHL